MRKSKVNPLTKRETECLLLAANGNTSLEIGRFLGITLRGVSFHMQNAIHKLNTKNRTQAVAKAITLGAIKPVL